MRRQLCGAVLVCLALFAMPGATGAAGRQQVRAWRDHHLKFRPATTATQRDAIMDRRSAGQIRRFTALGLHRLRLRNGQSVEAVLAAFRAQPEVGLAQLNYSAAPSRQARSRRTIRAIRSGSTDLRGAGANSGAGGLEHLYSRQSHRRHRRHRHRRRLPAPGSRGQHVGEPGEIPGNGLDDDGNGYVDDVYGIDTVNPTAIRWTTRATARTPPARSRQSATTASASSA